MEKERPDNEQEASVEQEKSKKSKRFIKFISETITKKPGGEEEKSEKSIGILQLIREFKAELKAKKESGSEDSEPPKLSDDELSQAKAFVGNSLDINLSNLKSEADHEERERIYIETILLSKIKVRLDNNQYVDIDEIVEQTIELVSAQEVLGENEDADEALISQADAKSPKTDTPTERDIVGGSVTSETPRPDRRTNNSEPKRSERVFTRASTGRSTLGTLESNPVSSTPQVASPETPESKTRVNRPIVELSPRPTPNIQRPKTETARPTINGSGKTRRENLPKPPRPFETIKNNDNQTAKRAELTILDKKIAKQTPAKAEREGAGLLDIEVLRRAEKVFIDRVSLKKIYENSDLTKGDLRRILSGESKKRKLAKDVKRALAKRKNSYEDIITGIRQPHLNRLSKVPGFSKRQEATNYTNKQASQTTGTPGKQAATFKQPTKKQIQTRPMPLLTIGIFIFVIIILVVIFLIVD